MIIEISASIISKLYPLFKCVGTFDQWFDKLRISSTLSYAMRNKSDSPLQLYFDSYVIFLGIDKIFS